MLFYEIVLEDSQGPVTHGRNAFDKSMEAWVANTHIQYLKPLGESCIHKNAPPSRTHLQFGYVWMGNQYTITLGKYSNDCGLLPSQDIV